MGTDIHMHVVFYSGGTGSWAAAHRVKRQFGTKDLILLFTDTRTEDEDLYRFVFESAANIGGELITISDGRNIWEVFFNERYLGNSRIDPCSKLLKRVPARKWVEKTFPNPDDVRLYVGIDWTETHRLPNIVKNWEPYSVSAPLCEKPYIDKDLIHFHLDMLGIKIPRLYDFGFVHNNCGGFCIKAGQAQFKLLLQTHPERFKYHEEQEQKIREFLDKDVSILRKMENGVRRQYTLKELREDVEKSCDNTDPLDIGGCGCFVD